MPLDGLKITPDSPLLADQLRAPVEPGASASVVVQFQPPLPVLQSLFAERLLELLVSAGDASQLHNRWLVLCVSSSVKTRSALAGQFILERVMLTCSTVPGARLPLDGLKNTPGVLLDADQFRSVSVGSLPSMIVQYQSCSWLLVQLVFASRFLYGLIVSPGDFVQLHGTRTVLPGPLKVKEPVWQSLFGTEIVTGESCPGDSVPLDCVKLTPAGNVVLADQLMLL